jgi:hypothetical protein
MKKIQAKNYLSAKYIAALAVALVLAIFIGTQIGNGDTTAEDVASPETTISQEDSVITEEEEEATTDSTVDTSTLAEMLTFIVQEEKLAHDLYVQLASTSGAQQFQNVLNSESTHISLVQGLLATYNVVDPTIGLAEGEFVDQELQALYDSLLASGSVDRAGAIAAGIAVEEKDIADIEVMLASELPSDVASVLERLLSGSQNHLAAFQRG